MSEFIEFCISSPDRLVSLQRVFAELKRDKDSDNWRSCDELLRYFDADSIKRFYWPADDERRQRIAELQTAFTTEIPTDQAPGETWDFDSMIDAFANGEYILVSCERTCEGMARLNFEALAYPYGGVGCMVALVEAFGHTITGIDDGTGYSGYFNAEFPS